MPLPFVWTAGTRESQRVRCPVLPSHYPRSTKEGTPGSCGLAALDDPPHAQAKAINGRSRGRSFRGAVSPNRWGTDWVTGKASVGVACQKSARTLEDPKNLPRGLPDRGPRAFGNAPIVGLGPVTPSRPSGLCGDFAVDRSRPKLKHRAEGAIGLVDRVAVPGCVRATPNAGA
jgi:hypothetical protein